MKRREPWSSGYMRRLIVKRSWLRIPSPDGHFFTMIFCKNFTVCLFKQALLWCRRRPLYQLCHSPFLPTCFLFWDQCDQIVRMLKIHINIFYYKRIRNCLWQYGLRLCKNWRGYLFGKIGQLFITTSGHTVGDVVLRLRACSKFGLKQKKLANVTNDRHLFNL